MSAMFIDPVYRTRVVIGAAALFPVPFYILYQFSSTSPHLNEHYEKTLATRVFITWLPLDSSSSSTATLD